MPSGPARWMFAVGIAAALLCLALAASALADLPDVSQVNPLDDGVGGVALAQFGASWHLQFPSDIFVTPSGGALQISGSQGTDAPTNMPVPEACEMLSACRPSHLCCK